MSQVNSVWPHISLAPYPLKAPGKEPFTGTLKGPHEGNLTQPLYGPGSP